MKIVNDIRFLISGQRCGFREMTLTSNDLGSLIVPDKINPIQCQSMTMLIAQVMENHDPITIAVFYGHFELNVFIVVIICNFSQLIRLLSEALISFVNNYLLRIEPNSKKIDKLVHESVIALTLLELYIGYTNAAKITKNADK